jgi:hypothetical protein
MGLSSLRLTMRRRGALAPRSKPRLHWGRSKNCQAVQCFAALSGQEVLAGKCDQR